MKTWHVAMSEAVVLLGLACTASAQERGPCVPDKTAEANVSSGRPSDPWKGTPWEGYCEKKLHAKAVGNCPPAWPKGAEDSQASRRRFWLLCFLSGNPQAADPDGAAAGASAAGRGGWLRQEVFAFLHGRKCEGECPEGGRGYGSADAAPPKNQRPQPLLPVPSNEDQPLPKNELPDTAPHPYPDTQLPPALEPAEEPQQPAPPALPRNTIPKSDSSQASPRVLDGHRGTAGENAIPVRGRRDVYVSVTGYSGDHGDARESQAGSDLPEPGSPMPRIQLSFP
jgi:hypothetical protein